MVKKILFVMMLILPLGMMAQNYKFGHVYMSEIMVLMPEYKTAQDEMQELQKKYVDEINMADQELQKKYTEYMNQRDSLPPSIQERREKEIQDLAQRGEEFKGQVQQILGQKQQELKAVGRKFSAQRQNHPSRSAPRGYQKQRTPAEARPLACPADRAS